jgi:hypothetical protein
MRGILQPRPHITWGLGHSCLDPRQPFIDALQLLANVDDNDRGDDLGDAPASKGVAVLRTAEPLPRTALLESVPALRTQSGR